MSSQYTPEQRIIAFWNKVNKNGSIPIHCPELGQCWEWIGANDGNIGGYGSVNWEGRKTSAHRIAWQLTNGEIPNKLEVCHCCDNPSCCNPNHLFLGTHKQNMDDRDRKGRNVNYRGEDHGRHKLTYLEVTEIRERYAKGGITQKQLSKDYSVCKSMIGYVIRRENWK